MRLEVLKKELTKELNDIKEKNKKLNNNQIKNEKIISDLKREISLLKKDNEIYVKKMEENGRILNTFIEEIK